MWLLSTWFWLLAPVHGFFEYCSKEFFFSKGHTRDRNVGARQVGVLCRLIVYRNFRANTCLECHTLTSTKAFTCTFKVAKVQPHLAIHVVRLSLCLLKNFSAVPLLRTIYQLTSPSFNLSTSGIMALPCGRPLVYNFRWEFWVMSKLIIIILG